MNIAICDDEQIYADEIKKHVECYFTRRETLWTRTQKADHETGAADNK